MSLPLQPAEQTTYSISAKQTDVAGNESAVSDGMTLVVGPPAAPDLLAGSDTGSSDSDDITNDTQFAVAGALLYGTDEGVPVRIIVNDEIKAEVTVTGTVAGLTVDYDAGTWSYAPPEPLPNGDYVVKVAFGDLESAGTTVHLDVEAPDTEITLDDVPRGLVLANEEPNQGASAEYRTDFGTSFTFAASVFVANDGVTLSDDQTIFHTSRDGTVYIEHGTGNLIVWSTISTTTVDSGLRIEEAGWHDIAISVANGVQTVYLDGESSQVSIAANNSTFLPQAVRFGATLSDRGLVSGVFRDVHIWGTGLSAAELDTAMAGQIDLGSQDLIGYWSLSENTDSALVNEKEGANASDALTLKGEGGEIGQAPIYTSVEITGDGAEANASIVVTAMSETGVELSAKGVADEDGNWSALLEVPTTTNEVEYTVNAHQIDVAGNEATLESNVVKFVAGGGVTSISSVMDGESALDVRSQLVFAADNDDTLTLTDKDGVYHVTLVAAEGGAGYLGETDDGSQTITITVVDGVASFSGGILQIDAAGRVEIDFEQDFDLGNSFTLTVDQGLLLGEVSRAYNVEASIEFATVMPTVTGSQARIWKDGVIGDGAKWYDGSGGSYIDTINAFDTDLDLSSESGVVVVGRDIADDSTITVSTASRANIAGFGTDDFIYVDTATGATPNAINGETISITPEGGNVPTALLFGGTQGQAAALIHFADNPNTPVEENGLSAVAFWDADLEPNSGDYSFEGITGNGDPVISG